MSTEFETYLAKKKISSRDFKSKEPEMWERWATSFSMLHPDSFTSQKLFLINPIRRRYPLVKEPIKEEVKTPQKAKPKFIRKKAD